MTNHVFTESVVEEAALGWLQTIGWQTAHSPDIAPDMPGAECRDYGEVVLARRLRDALARIKPALPAEALEETLRKLTRPEGAVLIQRNRVLRRSTPRADTRPPTNPSVWPHRDLTISRHPNQRLADARTRVQPLSGHILAGVAKR